MISCAQAVPVVSKVIGSHFFMIAFYKGCDDPDNYIRVPGFISAIERRAIAGSPQFFKCIDQSIGGRVMALHFILVLQFGEYLTGQLLAQFHPPLVETEDIPDNA